MQQKKLTVAGLVQDLVSDQRLSVADAKLFAAGVRQGRTKMSHPIELIDAAGLTDMANPAQTLTAETLMLWLSKRSDLSYYRVDPLKIDTPLVTRVMSGEFARRHQILAVEVNAREILILCSEPYVTSWVSMIEQSQIGKTIVRALASPADIRRYTDEFYAMANSVKKASAQGLAASALGNLEQMV
jgi:general secretion pathway protein E